MKSTYIFLSLLLLVFTFSFSSALICNPNLPNGCPEEPLVSPIISGANYSINVNNTEHLEGRDTSQLYTYFQSLFDSVYCKLTGCNMTGNINMNGYNVTNAGNLITNLSDSLGDSFTYTNGSTGYLNVSSLDNRYMYGGGKTFYFTNHSSDIGGYYNTTHSTSDIHAQATITTTTQDGETTIAQFLSPLEGEYAVAEGTRTFYITASVDSLAKEVKLRGYIYLTNSTGGNQTLLRNSSLSTPLTLTPTEYTMTSVGDALIIPNDTRILFKIVSLKDVGADPDVTLYLEDDTLSRLVVPSPTGVTDLSNYYNKQQTYNKSEVDALIPTNLRYYFYNTTASGFPAGYTIMNTTLSTGVTLNITNISSLTNGQTLATRINPNTNLTRISAGQMTGHTHVQKISGTKDLTVYGEFWIRQANGTEYLLTTTSDSSVLANGIPVEINLLAPIAETDLNVTDRLVWRLKAHVSGVGTDPPRRII